MRTIIKVDILSNIVQGGGLYIYESEDIAIRNRNISEYGSEHRKVVCTGRETQECNVGTQDRNRNRNKNKNRNWNWTKLEKVILRSVLVITKFERGTKFWEYWELM